MHYTQKLVSNYKESKLIKISISRGKCVGEGGFGKNGEKRVEEWFEGTTKERRSFENFPEFYLKLGSSEEK